MRLALAIIFACAAPVLCAGSGPDWDSSGNWLLTGTYNFRQVLYTIADPAGDLFDAATVTGSITFDGNGHYSLSGATALDLTLGVASKLSRSGSYSISLSGFGYIDSPIEGGDRVYALVSGGEVVGSTTETGGGYNDLFVAAQANSNSALQGTYAIVYYSPSFSASFTSAALMQITADGMGNIAPASVTGFSGNGGAPGFTASLGAATYTLNNGAGVLTLPDASIFAQASESLNVSPDGSFVFGGAPGGYDMFIGIRIDGQPGSALSGLLFEAGIDQDLTSFSNGIAPLSTWYGAISAQANGAIHHRRLNCLANANPIGATFSESTAPPAQYVVSSQGSARVGIAVWPHIGIQVALAAPVVSLDGVFLNPQGVMNSASSAPFTSGISPGEWITLYGSNLAPSPAGNSSAPLAVNLNGVQVMVDGQPAQLSYVDSGQISALVPFGIPAGIATIQVINNGAPSNTITTLVNRTAQGVFMASGGPYAIAFHGDYSLVSPSNPAQAGETVAVYVDGMGTVSPPDTASPLRYVSGAFAASLDGAATPPLSFAGLAPGLTGVYQINFQIPAGTAPGDHVLGISGPDSRTAQALITTQ